MSDLIGRSIGQYRIVEQLGIGGMATVCKAYQPAMDRYVAIKVPPDYLARDPSFRARFLREAKTLAHLEHPHILPVYDAGEDDGLPYFVMRCIEGGTLREMIASGPLPLNQALRIVEEVAEALGYAHRQGVTHRDVKSANVLVDQNGVALLTDFGIAKVLEESNQLTGTGVALGTPYYMAPEQVQGKPVDGRTDIYSLGVMLYELVTGRRPFVAETPLAVAMMHVNDPLPLPRLVNPAVPEAVERIILRAMAKDPADRFQTADEFASALRALLNESTNPPDLTTPFAVLAAAGGSLPLAAATGPDGRIFAMGGTRGQAIKTVEAYTPSTNTWVAVAGLPTARYLLAAATGADLRVGGSGALGAIGGRRDLCARVARGRYRRKPNTGKMSTNLSYSS